MPTRTTRSTTSLNSLRRQSPISPLKNASGTAQVVRWVLNSPQRRQVRQVQERDPQRKSIRFTPLLFSSLPLFSVPSVPLCFPFFPVSLPPPVSILPPCKPFGTHPSARKSRDSPRVFEEPLNFLFVQSENSFNPQPTARKWHKPPSIR